MTTDDFLHGLLDYGTLPPEAHRALADHAAAHSALQSVHDEVALLGADAPPEAHRDAVLAHYAATRRLPQAPPPALAALYERLEARLAADRALAARFEALAERLAAVDAASEPVWPPVGTAAARPAAARPPRLQPAGRWVKRLGGLAAALVLGYGVLAVLSTVLRSDLDRLAALPVESVRTDGISLRTRGPETAASPDALFLEALRKTEAAWRAPLGLFPHYDADALGEAIRALEATVAAAPPDRARFVRHESLLLLARLRIAARDLDGARAALRQLLVEDADNAADAQALLDDLGRVTREA